MVRISAGQFKGWVLKTPAQIRATEGKVRQALFNILGDFIQGARVADCFAGSGALGFEALSRGAAFVAFIEADTQAVLSIRENVERFSEALPREFYRIVHMDVERALRSLAGSEEPFDLVLLDPPYGGDAAKKALNAVVEYAILAPAGIIIVEHHQRTVLPTSVGSVLQWKQHRYGDTVLSFYQG